MIFGLLGPNGASKTTLMQMVATLMKPTSGTILIDGMTADRNLLEIHRNIGFLTTEIKLDPLSTPDRLFSFLPNCTIFRRLRLQNADRSLSEDSGIEPFRQKKL